MLKAHFYIEAQVKYDFQNLGIIIFKFSTVELDKLEKLVSINIPKVDAL
jgi:hypothetical protein